MPSEYDDFSDETQQPDLEPSLEPPLDPKTVDPTGTQTDVPGLDSTQEELSAESDKRVKSVVTVVPPSSSPTQVNEDTIPSEILEVLGVPKRSEETFGKKIPSEISER